MFLTGLPLLTPSPRPSSPPVPSPSASHRAPLKYFPPATPGRPHVYQRVPMAERVHWNKLWNPRNDPAEIDCSLAFNTLMYCSVVPSYMTALYQTAVPPECGKSFDDLRLCLRVRGLALTNPARARELLEAEEPRETEHVFRFRTKPPPDFLGVGAPDLYAQAELGRAAAEAKRVAAEKALDESVAAYDAAQAAAAAAKAAAKPPS